MTLAHHRDSIRPPLRQRSGAMSGAEEQFLRLQLTTTTQALLSIRQLSEVLKISSDRIAPIPDMPAWVMGVYNWRGQILWMADLAHLIGLPSWHQQGKSLATLTVAVFDLVFHPSTASTGRHQTVGLVVQQVSNLEWCNPATIQSPSTSTASPQLSKFLRGYWMKADGELLAVLSDEAIATAMPRL